MQLDDLLASVTDAGVVVRGVAATERIPALDNRHVADIPIGSVVLDSRRVTPGALFCCIPGGRSDGHDFAPVAVASGARALLVERFLDDSGSTMFGRRRDSSPQRCRVGRHDRCS
jgi:UDP-N-acetylmuramyl tripeptide synthase